MEKGETLNLQELQPEQHFTKPPARFSEATLIRAMEENGIGRPSTRANIIETLFRRKYVIRKKKQLLPTDTGIKLISTIKNELLKSAELTGRWEKRLKEIERGEFNAGTFIKNMKKMKTYKGIRHIDRRPVRGQRTKSNFRKNKGGGLGVRKNPNAKKGK